MATFRYVIRDTIRQLTRHFTVVFLTLLTIVAVFLAVGMSILLSINVTAVSYTHLDVYKRQDVTLLVEYADVEAMARQSGVEFEEMLNRLLNGGITAVSFKDLTGADLRDGDSPVLWGTLRSLLPERSSDSLSDNAALFIPKEYDDWFFEKDVYKRQVHLHCT